MTIRIKVKRVACIYWSLSMCQAQLYGEGIMVIILILQVRKRAQGHTANKSFDTILFTVITLSLFTVLITSILKECPVSPLSTLSSHYRWQHPHLATSTFKHSNTHSYPSLPLSSYLQERSHSILRPVPPPAHSVLSSHLLRNLTFWIILPVTSNFSIQLDPFHWHLNVLNCLLLKQWNYPLSPSQPNIWKDIYISYVHFLTFHFFLHQLQSDFCLSHHWSSCLKSLMISMFLKPMDLY